jgi:NADH dehydrogenase FAD-containing subunit
MPQLDSPSKPQQTVVVVGGGYAGTIAFNQLSRRLDENTHLVLVTARPYFVHLPAAARLVISKSEVTERGFVDKVLWAHTSRFNVGNRRTVYGKVVGITDGEEEKYVVLESGEKVEYTYLVLAPGSRWEGLLDFPDTKEGTVKRLHEWYEKFEKAEDIALVGGGGIAFGMLFSTSMLSVNNFKFQNTPGSSKMNGLSAHISFL